MDVDRDRLNVEAQFLRMAHVKVHHRASAHQLGTSLAEFYKGSVQRTRKFASIASVWETLVPAELNEHCCLESYRAGTLTVLVDSSPHLYTLKQLLLSGVQAQVLGLCCTYGLRKISLKLGRWYEGSGRDTRIKFEAK